MRKSSSDFASSRVRASTLSKQSHVLDRDHGLVGEGGHQLDLLVGKWLHLRRVNARTPIGTPSRNIGRLRMVRKPPSFCASAKVYSGSA